jgi:hypothetical protein
MVISSARTIAAMKGLRTLAEIVGITALGTWLGTLLMTSAAAGVTFPVVKKLDPRLPGLDAYTGEHWRLVAGRVMYNVFFVADIVQVTCAAFAAFALFMLAVAGGPAGSRWASRLRNAGFAAALALLGTDLAWLKPRMNSALLAYWDAAKAGDNAHAAALEETFRSFHPTATALLTGCTFGVFLALLGAVGRLTSSRVELVTRPSALDRPSLLGMRR